jgi:TPR repeat protein
MTDQPRTAMSMPWATQYGRVMRSMATVERAWVSLAVVAAVATMSAHAGAQQVVDPARQAALTSLTDVAKSGSADAQLMLAQLLEDGGPSQRIEAVKWYLAAGEAATSWPSVATPSSRGRCGWHKLQRVSTSNDRRLKARTPCSVTSLRRMFRQAFTVMSSAAAACGATAAAMARRDLCFQSFILVST